jgi:DNA-binding transcriptional MerR regulator
MTERRAVKMSVLAQLSNVPAATIKHYVREGLLPAPVRTSRNMAYYDVELVPRIQRIKELQRGRFLPLRVIREILDGPDATSPDETVAAAIARALEHDRARDQRTRAELESAGIPSAELRWLEKAGIVKSVTRGADQVFEGDDLALLRVLGAARKAGLTADMLPVAILGEYAAAMHALVRAELRLFREGVVPHAGSDLAELTEAATTLSERLVVLVRRKMLLPTLRELAAPPEAETKKRRTKASARKTPRK